MNKPTTEELNFAVTNYSNAILSKSKYSKSSNNLIELEEFYRNELKSILIERSKLNKTGEDSNNYYLTREELGKLMEWKLARGSWRPKLHDLVLSNSESLIKSTTLTASTKLNSPQEALKTLTILSGVGPATASAILALFSSISTSTSTSTSSTASEQITEPFFSDEAYYTTSKDKIAYTVKGYETYKTGMIKRLKEEETKGWEGGMETLEMAAWSYGWMKGEHERVKKEEIKVAKANASAAVAGAKKRKQEEEGGKEHKVAKKTKK